MTQLYHAIVCNLCGLDEADVVEVDEPPFKVVKCRRCGLVYVNPQPAQQDLVEHYSNETYYKEWLTVQAKARISLWHRRLKDIEKYKQKGRLLDIGCGEGMMLKMARDNGWTVQGTEVSRYACRYAREQYGLDVLRGNLEEGDFEEGSFDVVTLWHVLEHLSDPLATLKEARRLLRSDGVLLVETPNVNNHLLRLIYYLVRGKKKRLFSADAREKHLFHFSPVTLERIVQKGGFLVMESLPKPYAVSWPKKFIQGLGLAVFHLTQINIADTVRIHAKKA